MQNFKEGNMSITIHDMNNLAMRVIHIKDVKTVDKKTKKVIDIDWTYWRYVMFSSIYASMFKEKTSELILAVDSKNSWRYEIWSRYKEDRKKKKKKTDDEFPWDTFFEKYQEFLDDIQTCLPWKVIKLDRCEADDVIGIIAIDTPKKVTIISTDKDFLQLSSDRVKIYNPMKKQYISHPNPVMFLTEQCLIGQKKDSIFNIKTPLNWPDGKRKPGFGPKAFEKVVEYGVIDWLNDNNHMDQFKFNQKLMSFNLIPDDIQESIMSEYNNYEYPEPDMIWDFIKRQGWPEYIDDFTQVENKLMGLY